MAALERIRELRRQRTLSGAGDGAASSSDVGPSEDQTNDDLTVSPSLIRKESPHSTASTDPTDRHVRSKSVSYSASAPLPIAEFDVEDPHPTLPRAKTASSTNQKRSSIAEPGHRRVNSLFRGKVVDAGDSATPENEASNNSASGSEEQRIRRRKPSWLRRKFSRGGEAESGKKKKTQRAVSLSSSEGVVGSLDEDDEDDLFSNEERQLVDDDDLLGEILLSSTTAQVVEQRDVKQVGHSSMTIPAVLKPFTIPSTYFSAEDHLKSSIHALHIKPESRILSKKSMSEKNVTTYAEEIKSHLALVADLSAKVLATQATPMTTASVHLIESLEKAESLANIGKSVLDEMNQVSYLLANAANSNDEDRELNLKESSSREHQERTIEARAEMNRYEDLLMITADKVIECRTIMSNGSLYRAAQVLRKHAMKVFVSGLEVENLHSGEETSEIESDLVAWMEVARTVEDIKILAIKRLSGRPKRREKRIDAVLALCSLSILRNLNMISHIANKNPESAGLSVEGYVDAMEYYFDGYHFALTTALNAIAKSSAEDISLCEAPKRKSHANAECDEANKRSSGHAVDHKTKDTHDSNESNPEDSTDIDNSSRDESPESNTSEWQSHIQRSSFKASLKILAAFGRLLLSVVSEMAQIQAAVATDFQLIVSSKESFNLNTDRIQLVSHTLLLKYLPKLSNTLEDSLMIVGGPCFTAQDSTFNTRNTCDQKYCDVLHSTVRAFYDELEVMIPKAKVNMEVRYHGNHCSSVPCKLFRTGRAWSCIHCGCRFETKNAGDSDQLDGNSFVKLDKYSFARLSSYHPIYLRQFF